MKKAFMWIAIIGVGYMALSAIGKSVTDKRRGDVELELDKALESLTERLKNADDDIDIVFIKKDAIDAMVSLTKSLPVKQRTELRDIYEAKINAM